MIIAEDQTRATNDDHNRSTRDQPIQPIINCDLYISLEGSSSSMVIKSLASCVIVLYSVLLFALLCYMKLKPDVHILTMST